MFQNRPDRVRYFTPHEANALLPEIVSELEKAKQRVLRFHHLSEQVREGVPTNQQHQITQELELLRAEVRAIVEGIHARGVEVKGVRQGLLDFPALRYGQEVFLCWREGESAVQWWHPLSTGIQGRQPLPLADGDEGAWEWYN